MLSLAVTSFPANFTMNLTCIEGENASHCMQMIRNHHADLTVLDAQDIHMIGSVPSRCGMFQAEF